MPAVLWGGEGSALALISLTQNLCPSRREKDACKLTHNWTREPPHIPPVALFSKAIDS